MSTYSPQDEDLIDPYGVAGNLPGVTDPGDDLERNARILPDANDLMTPAGAAPAPAQAEAPPIPEAEPGPAALGDELATPGADLAPEQVTPGMVTGDTSLEVAETKLAPLGPPPQPDKLTGDPQKDLQNDIAYHQKLTKYEGDVARHQADLAKIKGEIAARNQGRVAGVAKDKEDADKKAFEAEAKMRADRDSAINAEVAKQQEAEKDLSKGYFEGKGTGDRIWAALMIALGGIGQGMKNAAAAKIGQVGQAQNQGLKALDAMMEDDYRRKQAKVAGAKDSVLQARYGFDRAVDNHRAAQNNTDALFAARWKTIAEETKAELSRRGLSDAEIAADETYAHALAESNKYTTNIHEREIDRAERERHDRAQEKTAEINARRARSDPFAMMRAREAAAEAKEQRGRNVKTVTDFNKQWEKTHGPNSQFGKASDLNVKLYEGLEKAKSTNPEDQNFALQDIARLVKGGTLTQYANVKDTAALGSTLDQIRAWSNRNKGLGLPPEMQKRLVDSYNRALDGTVDTLGRVHGDESGGDVARYMGENTGYYGIKRHVLGAFQTSYAPIRNSRGENPFKTEMDPNAPAIDLVTGEQIIPERKPAPPAALPGPGRGAFEGGAKPKGAPAPAGKPSQAAIDQALEVAGNPGKYSEAEKKQSTKVLTAAGLL